VLRHPRFQTAPLRHAKFVIYTEPPLALGGRPGFGPGGKKFAESFGSDQKTSKNGGLKKKFCLEKTYWPTYGVVSLQNITAKFYLEWCALCAPRGFFAKQEVMAGPKGKRRLACRLTFLH
jgi:hypothetical protein